MNKLAQVRPPGVGAGEITADGVVTIKGFEWIYNNVITIAIGVAGITLFVMLVNGGFNLLTAGADAGKAQAAQKTITWAIGGLVFIALAFIVLWLIADFTGIPSLLKFTVK